MGLTASEGGGDYTPAPAGTHIAVCVQLIDLGTQFSAFYNKSAHKVLIGWEIDEQRADGERFLVWRRYTVSLHKKAQLRSHLEAWRGRSFTEDELKRFDLTAVLGKPCQISITHRRTETGTYADVAAVLALGKGQQAFEHGPLVQYDLDKKDEPEMRAVFEQLGERLRAQIMDTPEWRGDDGEPEPVASSIAEDDIPF